jgi:hypothetical protein
MAQPGESHRQVVFTIYKKMVNQKPGVVKLAPCDCPNEGIEFIDGAATGCLFIKREVFEKLERPYFEFKYDPITRMPIEGEDIGFCLKMAKLGIKFLVDYSMICKHYKNNIDLVEMNNYAMSYAQKCVNYQSELIRTQVKELEQKYMKLRNENKQLKAMLSGSTRPPTQKSGEELIYR